jgi:hypothetical protein
MARAPPLVLLVQLLARHQPTCGSGPAHPIRSRHQGVHEAEPGTASPSALPLLGASASGVALSESGFFLRNGSHFYPIGVNYWPASTGCNLWNADTFPSAEIQHDLDVLAASPFNSMRIFLEWGVRTAMENQWKNHLKNNRKAQRDTYLSNGKAQDDTVVCLNCTSNPPLAAIFRASLTDCVCQQHSPGQLSSWTVCAPRNPHHNCV